MRVLVVAVGRARGPVGDAVADYEARARRYWKLETVEVSSGARGSSSSGEEVMAAEEKRLLGQLPDDLELVALTRGGEATGSRELARYLNERAVGSHPGVAFALGGAFGLPVGVLDRAARRLSLSALTLPHDFARLVLMEQLYRAGTLLRGEPYHKG